MLVAFLHVGPDLRLPRLMVRSALGLGYSVVQMTDQRTPRIRGVAEVRRLPWDGNRLMTYRMRHLAQLDDSPVCIVDTDVLFQRDVSDVWKHSFDIALTRRETAIDENGLNLATVMPYNTGVMFSRRQAFWKEAHGICENLGAREQDWWGDQLAVKEAADGSAYRVLELPVEEWNYSPNRVDDFPEHARILHFKGPRKVWMRKLPAAQRLVPSWTSLVLARVAKALGLRA